MKEKITKAKIIIYILLLIEIVGLISTTVFYYLDVFNFQSLLLPEYLLLTSISVLGVDIIVFWIYIIFVGNVKSQSELKAAEVIGDDIQEAYNFAMLGLAVTDDNDLIVWTNELFRARHLDVIDQNIFAWQPALKELKEKNNVEAVAKLEINNRNYQVKFLGEAGLYIFKDTTDFESIYNYSKMQAPVIGILSIDNFDEVVKGEEDYNDTITKVKNIIFEYAKQYDILLRRFKDSNYSIICSYESLEKMKADNFSIIDRVREASEGENIPLTLSIGLATGFPDVVKLNEEASKTHSIAMSRGGDQVVLLPYGKDMEFFGGKTEAQEKRNRVRVRVLADSLISLIKGATNVLIMGHKNMDMDSLGAALGIKAICTNAGIKAHIVVDFKATEKKTKSAITRSFGKDELEQLIVSSKEATSLVTPNTLIVIVDVHTPAMVMAPKLLDLSNKIVVIDHHRRGEEYIEAPVFDYIDPSATSATEMIAELIRYSSTTPRIDIPSVYATIMLAGIFLDSDFFKNVNTGIRTFESSSILKEYGANNAAADDLLKDDFEEYMETSDIVKNMKTIEYQVVYAIADEDKIFDTTAISKAANQCLDMKDIRAAFVIGKVSNKEIKISARSDGYINVSLICEKMGGGGHFGMAAASFMKSDVKEVEKILLDIFDTYIKEARNENSSKNKEVM